jgi:Cu/Ag efflux protein CusF
VTSRSRFLIAALLLTLTLAACGEKAVPEKRYPLKGVVTILDPGAKTATIAAEKIDGWMEAMTMEYPVKPDSEFQKLHPGDKIEATVVVRDLAYYVTDITVK